MKRLITEITVFIVMAAVIGYLMYDAKENNLQQLKQEIIINTLSSKYQWKSKRLRVYTDEALTCNGIIDNCTNCKKVYKNKKNYGMAAY